MKPGYKTSEFWLTLITAVAGMLTAGGVLPVDFPMQELTGGAASVVVVVAYILSRGKVKASDSVAALRTIAEPAKEDGGRETLPPR